MMRMAASLGLGLGLDLVTLGALAASPFYPAAAMALAAVRSFRVADAPFDVRIAAGRTAADIPRAALPPEAAAPTVADTQWADFAISYERQSVRALRSTLLNVGGPDAEYLGGPIASRTSPTTISRRRSSMSRGASSPTTSPTDPFDTGSTST